MIRRARERGWWRRGAVGLGVSAAVDGSIAVAGAPGDDDFGDASGAAYLFGFGQDDCNDNGTLDVCEVLAGAADCNTNGRPDDCDVELPETVFYDDFVLVVSFYLLLYSTPCCC